MLQSKKKPTKSHRYKQGYYNALNPSKYMGSDPTKIIYRSGLELKFCVWCDRNPMVTRWACEIMEIPYLDAEGKKHRYYPDFYVESQRLNDSSSLKRMIIEIKPERECSEPLKPKKETLSSIRSYRYQKNMWLKNQWKWVYAKEFAKRKGMIFMVINEKTVSGLLSKC